jgi:predicted peroxiredoxin
MVHRIRLWAAAALLAIVFSGCQKSTPPTLAGSNTPAPVLISVISNMESNPQAVDMAMKLAGFSLDEKRDVFMFFNVKGVQVPVRALSDDAKFGDNDPVKQQLVKLIERGAKVHVCPICMKGLGVKDADIIEGAQVTNRGALFSAIDSNTCVFTY